MWILESLLEHAVYEDSSISDCGEVFNFVLSKKNSRFRNNLVSRLVIMSKEEFDWFYHFTKNKTLLGGHFGRGDYDNYRYKSNLLLARK